MTQRDSKGMEVGGSFRMGKHMYTHGGFMLMSSKSGQLRADWRLIITVV